MDKKDLIARFDKLEAEILKILSLPEINLDDSAKRQTIKASIKKHILAVNKAKELFEEYESLALQIEEFDKPKKNQVKAKLTIEEKKETKQTKDEYKDEIVVTKGEAKVVKTKKTKSSPKQM